MELEHTKNELKATDPH